MRSECIDHGCKGYGIGYATAWVWYDGRKRPTTKHRRVYFEATGDWPQVVRHKCDNPRCINVEHLEGGSYSDNVRDCIMRGRFGDTSNPGEANGRAVLTNEQVRAIRAEHVKGCKVRGNLALAKKYGVGPSQISRIVRREQRNDA